MKICTKCGISKDLSDFYQGKNGCIECTLQQQRQRRGNTKTIHGNTQQHKDNTQQHTDNTQQHTDNISDKTTLCILTLVEQQELRKLLQEQGTIQKQHATIRDNIKTIPGNTKKQTFVINMELLDKLNTYCKRNRHTQSAVLNHLLNEFLSLQEPLGDI